MNRFLKKLSALTLAAAMMVAATGCGNTASDSTTTPDSSSGSKTEASNTDTSGSGEQKVVTFFHRWPNEPKNSLINELIAEFETQHPDIKIQADCVLNDSYKEKVRVLVSGDTIPDVFCTWSDSFCQNLVSSGNIQELDEILAADPEWKDSFIESQLPPFQVDGKQYAMPLCMDGKVFFYNKEAFEKAGIDIPATYSDLIASFDKLKTAGYEIPLVEGLSNAWAVSHYQGSIIQRVIDPEVWAKDINISTMELTDPAYVQALDIFKELTSYMGDAASAMDHEAARNMFISGEVPMLFAQLAEIRIINGEASTGAAGAGAQFEFGFFNFPSVEGGKGNQSGLQGAPEGWMLSNKAKHPEAALEFYKFLLSKEVGEKYTKVTGELSAIKGAANENTANAEMMAAVDTIMGASEIVPWFDNAFEASIADEFMRGGQSLAIGDMTSEEVMESVRAAAEQVKADAA